MGCLVSCLRDKDEAAIGPDKSSYSDIYDEFPINRGARGPVIVVDD